jgi:hypothetical protein
MEVGNSSAFVIGEVLIVTTSITVRICVRHGSSSVEGLVEISDVMDDETKSE